MFSRADRSHRSTQIWNGKPAGHLGTLLASKYVMKKTMTWREATAERKRGAEFFAGLDNAARGELGDQLVLGDVDYLWWFGRRPSAAFLNGLDEARMGWEMKR